MMLVPRWCLFVLYVTGCHSHIYKPRRSWNGYEFHTYPHPAKKPIIPRDVMVDVINNLGLKLLAIHNEYNENNIAISPYGAISVLIALGEGLEGDAVYEIQQAAHIPNDISIIRVGLRDIHRHLKSYFIPKEGFLAGLTLNHENVTLRPEYEDILRFYGYDTVSFNNALYPDPETTEKPQVTSVTQMINTGEQTTAESGGTTIDETEDDIARVTTDNTAQVTTDMSTTNPNIVISTKVGGMTELPTTETDSTSTALPQSVTVAMEPKIMEVATTTVPTTTTSELATTETIFSSTEKSTSSTATTTEEFEEEDAIIRSATTILSTTTENLGEESSATTILSTTTENAGEESSTQSSRTTRNIPTSASTPSTFTSTEPSTFSTSSGESTTSIGVTTIGTTTAVTTSTTENTLTTFSETSTQVPTTKNIDTTMSDISETTSISTITEPTTTEVSKDGDLMTLATKISDTEITQVNEDATTTFTTGSSTFSTPTSTEITKDEDLMTLPTKIDAVETTQENGDTTSTVITISDLTTSQTASTLTANETPDDLTTAESTLITDSITTIVSTGNSATSTVFTTNDLTTISEASATTLSTNETPDVDVTTEIFTSTTDISTDSTTTMVSKENNDNEIGDTSMSDEGFGGTFNSNAQSKDSELGEASVVQLNMKQTRKNNNAIHKRTSRSVVDYIIARYYDDHYNHRRNYRPYIPEVQPSFLIYGKYREYNVNFMKYDTVLPFNYIPHLNALALSFPLDSTRYYLLLLLPVDEAGIDKLICDLRLNGSIKYIIENLRYTHVRATIPSFMLKGYVTLTPSFQKLGIRKVFEPRQADFAPMTNQREIYVTNIEQAITVTIRNYMDPNNVEDHRNLHQYDPVNFKADHPFLYFVIDSEIHVTLMAGKIVNPLNSRIS